MCITPTTSVLDRLLKRDFRSGSKISLQEPAEHGGCEGDMHVLSAPKLSPDTLLCVGYDGGDRYGAADIGALQFLIQPTAKSATASP